MRNQPDCSQRTRARFGAFEADLASGELFRDGKRVAIQDKPFSLLSLLLHNQGFITRDELFTQLWPNVFVQKDVSINTAIRRLRIALQDHDPSNGLIETVGSRGYRLKVAVEWLPNAGSEKPAALERIAVVPFADLNCPADDFFSDGLTEVTIAHLGRSCKNIAVVAPLWSSRARHNSQNLLRVAQQLHADFVLSGTVLRLDGCLRVTARLVRSNDQICVWTQSYVRDPRNFLAVQEEISADIAHEILPALADANASTLEHHDRG